ncbi:MAG: Hcp family type VI secretion system effector [Acidimicrobiales bacterium]
MAAVDFFLKLDGVDGESTDDQHKNELDIESFSWGLSNSGSAAHAGGGGRGKASFQDFHFTAPVSRASPKLFLACASGQHIPTATLTCRKAGGSQQEFMVIKMTDILISDYQLGGDETSEALPMEQVSMNYSKVEFEYRPQRADGMLEASVKAGWDVGKNVKI